MFEVSVLDALITIGGSVLIGLSIAVAIILLILFISPGGPDD